MMDNKVISKYQICTSCVMDTSDPEISFNDEGICDHCQNFNKNIKDDLFNNDKNRFKDLKKICEDINRNDNKEGYNCLAGISGGVDSSYLLHIIVKELKLKIPDMVYVYSQNSALSFLNFIKIHQSESHWMNTNLMCIGEKTSSILNEIKWKKIFLFNPGEEEFLLYKI